MTERETRLQRLHDLLADRATQGLSTAEAQELDALGRDFPDVDGAALDRCAAVIDLALERDDEPMPESLRAKVQRDGTTWVAARSGASNAAPQRRPLARLPWLLAAASLLLAVISWWPRGPGADSADRRAALLREAPDARVVPWTLPNDAGVTGDVAWSNQRQEGYLRIAGLGINNPADLQYQMWIFDAKRPGSAVSGGVFDVAAAGEIIVPIEAGVKVFEPTLFAVTTEPPGGVIQHEGGEKYRIILTAPVG